MVFSLKKIPFLSIGLLILTYGCFGWIYSHSIEQELPKLIEHSSTWGIPLNHETLKFLLELVGVMISIFISLALTSPIRWMNFFLKKWLTNDLRAVISILLGSFTFVFILCFLPYVIRFLILIASAILTRLDLQLLGYKPQLSITLITLLSVSSFLGGFILHNQLISN